MLAIRAPLLVARRRLLMPPATGLQVVKAEHFVTASTAAASLNMSATPQSQCDAAVLMVMSRVNGASTVYTPGATFNGNAFTELLNFFSPGTGFADNNIMGWAGIYRPGGTGFSGQTRTIAFGCVGNFRGLSVDVLYLRGTTAQTTIGASATQKSGTSGASVSLQITPQADTSLILSSLMLAGSGTLPTISAHNPSGAVVLNNGQTTGALTAGISTFDLPGSTDAYTSDVTFNQSATNRGGILLELKR